MAETVATKGLLGWMTEDEALRFLRSCVFEPPKSDAELLQLWHEYRDKVTAIGKRIVPTFSTHKLSLSEECSGKTLVNKAIKAGGSNVKKVIKVDPCHLLIHQLSVTLDQSERYAAAMRNARQRLNVCLGIGLENRLPIGPAVRDGDWLKKSIPHGEFQPFCLIGKDDFAVQEQARFISFTEFEGKLLLWAGYHRSHALVSHTKPDDTDRLLVGTLVTDGEAFLGPASDLPAKRDCVRGECPPLFSDFFNVELCINVQFLKLRCEIHWNPKTRQYRVPMIPI
jgi:hypothetical protein